MLRTLSAARETFIKLFSHALGIEFGMSATLTLQSKILPRISNRQCREKLLLYHRRFVGCQAKTNPVGLRNFRDATFGMSKCDHWQARRQITNKLRRKAKPIVAWIVIRKRHRRKSPREFL